MFWACWAQLLGLQLAGYFDLKVSGDFQFRGGYSETPFVFGANNIPLFNLRGQTQGQAMSTLILTPGADVGFRYNQTLLRLAYQPQFFFDFIAPRSNQFIIFHRVNTDFTYGRQQALFIQFNGFLSVGGLDFGQAGSVAQEFTGALISRTQSNALNFFNAGLTLKLSVPITSSIIFSTQESVTRYNLPPTTPGVFTNLSLPLAFASLNATAGGLLRSQNRLDTQQKLNYIFANKQHQVGFETFYSLVNFQSLGTYVAIMPTGTWALRRSSALQMDARLGILRSWLNPYPGVFERAQNMPVFELITTQGLNTIGLPRWSFSGELSQMPFYDVVTGLLVPRASITLQLTWAPMSRFSWQFSVRDFTPKLWFFTDNILPHGYTKNILVAGTQANYKINRYVSLNSGASTNISWVSRSTTLGYDHNKQIFAYVGIESLYDIR